LAGASSLREIIGGIESQRARLYHLGATLADANRDRPGDFFAALLAPMLGRAHRGLRRALAETTYLIDATGLRLAARSRHGAQFLAGVCGAKLHVVYDPDADRPIYTAITPARVNDITAAQAMPIEAGATYVFDLGYDDYAWWAKLDAAQCRIVTRRKSNTPLRVVAQLAVPQAGPILSDRMVVCRCGKGAGAPIRFMARSARSGSGSISARCCAFSQMTSMPRPKRLPISTSAAGRSNCFPAGSSRPSKSAASLALRKTRCGSRSRSR
jgi:Transposase DDE domain